MKKWTSLLTLCVLALSNCAQEIERGVYSSCFVRGVTDASKSEKELQQEITKALKSNNFTYVAFYDILHTLCPTSSFSSKEISKQSISFVNDLKTELPNLKVGTVFSIDGRYPTLQGKYTLPLWLAKEGCKKHHLTNSVKIEMVSELLNPSPNSTKREKEFAIELRLICYYLFEYVNGYDLSNRFPQKNTQHKNILNVLNVEHEWWLSKTATKEFGAFNKKRFDLLFERHLLYLKTLRTLIHGAGLCDEINLETYENPGHFPYDDESDCVNNSCMPARLSFSLNQQADSVENIVDRVLVTHYTTRLDVENAYYEELQAYLTNKKEKDILGLVGSFSRGDKMYNCYCGMDVNKTGEYRTWDARGYGEILRQGTKRKTIENQIVKTVNKTFNTKNYKGLTWFILDDIRCINKKSLQNSNK